MSAEQDLERFIGTPSAWRATEDVHYPWETRVEGVLWMLRLNDFPAEPLYTLFVGGLGVGDLEDWPEAWARAAAPGITASSAPGFVKRGCQCERPHGRSH